MNCVDFCFSRRRILHVLFVLWPAIFVSRAALDRADCRVVSTRARIRHVGQLPAEGRLATVDKDPADRGVSSVLCGVYDTIYEYNSTP